MLEIVQNQELNKEKLLSFRGRIRQTELESVGKDMESYIRNNGANRIGDPITVTYGVDNDLVDVELLLQVDCIIPSSDKYVYKDRIRIVNALVGIYKGNPVGLQESVVQLNKFITEHKLQPITVGYNLTKKVDVQNPDNTEINIYVGINPNIL
ncbi:MAG: hypothetical protein K6F65_04025 [Lachnospiraceae bacterium]|nr:hypothetical protein [Lachnospiraceae bacterium]